MAYQYRYVGPDLAGIASRLASEITSRACHNLAEAGTHALYRLTRERTPKDTSATADSWIVLPVTHRVVPILRR